MLKVECVFEVSKGGVAQQLIQQMRKHPAVDAVREYRGGICVSTKSEDVKGVHNLAKTLKLKHLFSKVVA